MFSVGMHVYCYSIYVRVLPLRLLINAATKSQHAPLSPTSNTLTPFKKHVVPKLLKIATHTF